MQKRIVKWVYFHNNEAPLTGNGVKILMEKNGWNLQELSRRTTIGLKELDSLIQAYEPRVSIETLQNVASVFGFRPRGKLVSLTDQLLWFFTSQQREIPE